MFNTFRRLVAVLGFLTASLLAHAQEMTEAEYIAALEAELPGTLMNNPVSPDWDIYGEDFSKRVISDPTAVGEQAIRVKVKRAKPNPWDITMTVRMDEGASNGDTILVAVWAKADKPPKGQDTGNVQVRLQQAAAPYAGLADATIMPGEKWELWYVSGVANADFGGDEINLAFNVAAEKQTIDIAQFYVMNLGQGVDPATLLSGKAQ